MKRLMTAVAALTLVAAACGGGDDASSDSSLDGPSEATADETADDATADETTTDEAGGDDTAAGAEDASADEPSADETADDTDDAADDTDDSADDTDDDLTFDDDDDTDDDTDTADGPEIRSLDDIPAECRDAMADFLREIEPIVAPIDWQNATMGDFEQIALEFEAKSDEFEAALDGVGCDDLNFVDDASDTIIIDFAQTEAPGAVGFLTFLEQLSNGFTPESGTGETGTCQDAIDFFQGLVDDYGSISKVPASELMKIPSIGDVYADCTLEQLEFFDSAELEEFMNS